MIQYLKVRIRWVTHELTATKASFEIPSKQGKSVAIASLSAAVMALFVAILLSK